jgi:hypothetical protein
MFIPKFIRESVDRLSAPKPLATEESINKIRSKPKEKVPTLTVNLQKSKHQQSFPDINVFGSKIIKVLPHNISSIEMPLLKVKKGSYQVYSIKI